MTDHEDTHDEPVRGAATGAEDEGASDGHAPQPPRKRPVARGTSLRRPGATPDETRAGVPTTTDPTAEPEASGAAEPDPESGEVVSGDADSSAGGWVNYALIAAAVVILVAALTVAFARPFAGRVSNEAYVNTALTTQVASIAKQAAKDIYSIDMNNVGQWEQRMNALLTPGMVDEAKKMRQGITQAAGQLQDVTITVEDTGLTAGVAFAAPNRAEVLLNVVRQVTERGVPGMTGQAPVKFVLDRFDGAWKVSSITEL